jgi:ABC-2 type transport system ATP-binding protein
MEGKLQMISTTDLNKTYKRKVHALRDVTLEIKPGMFGLVGPNGAGKTTLMRILAGLLRPTSGTVLIEGNDISSRKGNLAVKSMLGYLPQEFGVYPELTAYEFLEYITFLKGLPNLKNRHQQIEQVLEQAGLAGEAKTRLKTFSGGMKRRVGIAQALVGEPKILIVDEPTAGLDPEERIRLRNLFVELSTRCMVILSTHIIEDISLSCNDMAVIHLGRVLFHGSPRTLVDAARGKVWLVSTGGERPTGNWEIVSTLAIPEKIQYRLVGEQGPDNSAVAVEPSLEDGYVWLMQQARKIAGTDNKP